ncbi:hypothetical protein [Kitasatospora sp. NPDC097643]|uniref:SMP-30/gluconolactonase/LRE family protein n=1 Tax=Kitasatospora sp. NPDC097643 TaxID=3157230 RepID=UPI00332E3D8B
MPRSPRPAGLLTATVTAVALSLLAGTPAVAVAPPLSAPRILVHLDLATGQTPENIALEPDGSADVTFIGNSTIARITPDGQVHVLAVLPVPDHPATPVVGFPALAGIVRAHDGTLYVNYSTGTADLTGVWRLRPGGTPERIVALPVDSLSNGLALDPRHGVLYAADSALGLVRRIPLHGGAPTVWASGAELQGTTFIGANGIKVHHGAVWVSNTDRGSLLRIPIEEDGAAGPVEVRAHDIGPVDDFAFTGRGDEVLAALNVAHELALVRPDGTESIVLTRDDGLSNPTAVAVCGDTVYVTSAAFTTRQDPNLLLAHLDR